MMRSIEKNHAIDCSTMWLALMILMSSFGVVSAQTPLRATGNIVGCTDSSISGIATLEEEISNEGVKLVHVSVRVDGLEPSTKHAVHLHETGQCSPCSAAAGHFDPGPESNTSPDGNHPYHSGDLVNLTVDKKGVGIMQTPTNRITLSPGPLSLFDADGAAVIIHVNPDTYCPEGEAGGCAGGGRAACAVLSLVNG